MKLHKTCIKFTWFCIPWIFFKSLDNYFHASSARIYSVRWFQIFISYKSSSWKKKAMVKKVALIHQKNLSEKNKCNNKMWWKDEKMKKKGWKIEKSTFLW